MKGRRLNMEDCLHTSSDNLAKLVKWAHSHGTICTLIPNLKHMLNEGSHGTLTALWGCSAGHAYHWPLNTTCKTGNKERMCFQESRSINTDTMIQAAAAMQNSSADRFLGKKNKGDSNQIHDSCDISNCSEPSEMDDNGEEYNNNLYDIVCESSATDEDGDSDFNHTPNISHRKRHGKGTGHEDSIDPSLKKIKQERGEDYYSLANPQIPSSSEINRSTELPKPNLQSTPLMSQKPSSIDGDSMGVSSSPLDSSPTSMIKPLRAPFHVTQNKVHMNSNPACSQSMPTLPHPGRIDAMGVLHRDEYPRPSLSYGEASIGANPEMDLLSAQALSTEARADNTGSNEKMDYAVILKALHDHLIPAAHSSEEQFGPSDLSPNSDRYLEERKHLEEFITGIDTVTLQNLQTVIDRILVFHERTQMPLSSPARLGEQELFPGSGLYLPHYKLASMLQESRQDSMRLFHLLFEHFFSEEDLNGAVAFGKRGKVPDGKKVLDRRKVDGIMSYVLRCSTIDGWTPVESSKLKKACINKCRLRIGQKKKQESSQESFIFCDEQSGKNDPSYM
ncbi:uncharacterized protein KIAA1958 homolog isoform X4 [Danio rerio]|uniref:Uncharacterized protein KIAA1958 homolog isoform X4 n=1 Tax=Danio rerio TaxID=7955 RepID=A0A8M2B1T8_DANRE|nr:uncharacterized protein KIAA1958 homolog isoform X4 [Danio rerio]|eukprot:XP_005155670.1 uncharacterized protein KIAA1958 homolog isoform X4 [Danio rerio]